MKKEQKIRIVSISIGLLLGISTLLWTNLDSLEILVISIAGACLGYASTNPPGKRIWTTIGGIVGVYLILIGTMPLYNQGPDSELFTQTRNIKYYIESDMPDNKIFFENEKGQKTISTETTKQELFLPESKKIKLTLPLQKSKNSEILIQTTEGNVYSMYPESTIYIESEKIMQTEGKITSGEKNRLSEQYITEKNDYIIKQLGGNFFTNTTIRKIQSTILSIANRIHPSKYEQNVKNEESFAKFFNWKKDQPTSFEDKSNDIQNNMRENIKETFQKTRSSGNEE